MLHRPGGNRFILYSIDLVVLDLYYAPQTWWSWVYITLHRPGGLWFIVRYTDLVDQYRRKDVLSLKREGSYGWLSNSERSRASIHVCCAPSSFLPAATSGQGKTEGPDAGFCFYRCHLNCEELRMTPDVVQVFCSSRLLDRVFCRQPSFFHLIGRKLSFSPERSEAFNFISSTRST
jgi:hypothetical protein